MPPDDLDGDRCNRHHADHEDARAETPTGNPAAAYAREHPIAAGALGIAVLGGGFFGFHVFAETLTPIRSVLGGALAGFGCWFLVMIGRVIGD
jgi:hypothetical protein